MNMRAFFRLWPGVLVLTLGSTGCQRADPGRAPVGPHQTGPADVNAEIEQYRRLPEGAKAILEQVDQLEVWSLHPEPPEGQVAEKFHRCAVLGKTVVNNAEMRGKVIAAVHKGVAESQGVAGCFKPRHGIRATRNGQTVDLVICFECLWMDVHVGGKHFAVWTSPSPELILDRVLGDAQVRLAPKPE